jgi:hypothetical protein
LSKQKLTFTPPFAVFCANIVAIPFEFVVALEDSLNVPEKVPVTNAMVAGFPWSSRMVTYALPYFAPLDAA